MATKATKKPGSLVDKNKDFMANFSYDMLNKKQPSASAQPAPAAKLALPPAPAQMSNTDVVDTFNGLRQQATPQGYKRPVTRRGMSGQELDANGNDPGSGMSWFDKNNSPAQVDARNARQGVLDQRRGNQMAAAGASAVAERKALQEMGQAPFQLDQANRAANSVKGNDGYMTLFDGKGNAVGTNRPPAQKSNWAAQNAAYPGQTGPALSATNPMNPNLQSQIQEGFNQDAKQPRPMGPPKNFLDSYATPGGSNVPVVGSPSAPGTPVGGNSQAPKATPQFSQPPPNSGPAPSGIDYNFDAQIADQLKRNMPAPSPATPYNDPFVGAPYGGKLSAAQNEIMGLFAPKTTGSGMFGERQQTGQVRPGNTGPMDSVLPGAPGQLGWPMMQNKDVNSFAQFFPGMNWSADYGDASRSRIQQNFNDLIKQNAVRVGPDGNYQIIPQYPMEQMMKQY
jgi:hypothetical protein